MRIEILPLLVNICCLTFYTVQWKEPGKCLYWLGATFLTIGLLKMKG